MSVPKQSSSFNFQNSYVRYKVGAPVVPVVKSIQTVKNIRINRDNSPNELNISSESRQSEEEYTDNNSTCLINESIISQTFSEQSSSPPAYFSNTRYGEEMLLPIQGYFCSICDQFFDTHEKAFQEHCTTKSHYDNYISLYNETLKLNRCVDRNSPTLDKSNDLGNPLPIKIKIENSDTFFTNDNVKKPLSERLGAVKKTNKSKLAKKLKNQPFDGDYNKSVLQYLPKPSSHITPSRKVFVEDFGVNVQTKFGTNGLYSSQMYH